MRNKGFTLIELMIVVVIIGILAAIAIPNFISMQARAKEASAKANAHTTQLAAEDFSVQNDGVYAATPATALANNAAVTMITLLPGQALLTNPFTKVQDSPVNGAAGAPGQVGYTAIADPNNAAVFIGYTIDADGKDGNVILTLSSGQ